MAEVVRAKADFSEWDAMFNRLLGPARVSLARSMGVAAGTVIRDEAIVRAPVGTEQGGSITPGLLKSSIYLAYKDQRSSEQVQMYSVSWNARKAPHGHLVEFGHWENYVVFRGEDGEWHTAKSLPLANPKWVAAKPFLRPAYESSLNRAREAAIKRGHDRLPELLRGGGEP